MSARTHGDDDGADWTASNAGTTSVRPEHRFDEENLTRWMEKNVEFFNRPVTVRQFKGGQSNPTFKITTPHRSYVMRRRPSGHLLDSAHAVDREYRVMSALHQIGYPVPRTHTLCEDESILGSSFYVMDCVEGRIFWDPGFSQVPREDRPLYFRSMNDTLAQLHRLEPGAIGLGNFGRPGNFIERQISRFTRQYLADEEAGRIAAMDRTIDWLTVHRPAESEIRVVHGDFRVDNLIFHPTEPRIVAVLDWELSTLGDPLADFAFHAMMYRMPRDITTGILGVDLAQNNIPSEEHYLDMYCQNTRRRDLPHYDFYVVFGMFRLAAIMHGIKGRVLRGTSASTHAARAIEGLDSLAELAWCQARSAR